ncbi:MAG: hypothetical protein ABR595_09200 [Psychroflexus sp.]
MKPIIALILILIYATPTSAMLVSDLVLTKIELKRSCKNKIEFQKKAEALGIPDLGMISIDKSSNSDSNQQHCIEICSNSADFIENQEFEFYRPKYHFSHTEFYKVFYRSPFLSEQKQPPKQF